MIIEVMKRPDGPAPEEIRDTWIGLLLDADVFPVGVPVKDTTGKIIGERSCWYVDLKDALRELEKKSPKAANWFRENYPQNTKFLAFGCDETEVIELFPK